MEVANPFAQMPLTPEPIIAQVLRELAADCEGAPCPRQADLDHVAETAVRDLWNGRVKVFAPVLALRQARETLHLRGRSAGAPAGPGDMPAAPSGRRSRRDVIRVENDVLRLDDRDTFRLSDDDAIESISTGSDSK